MVVSYIIWRASCWTNQPTTVVRFFNSFYFFLCILMKRNIIVLLIIAIIAWVWLMMMKKWPSRDQLVFAGNYQSFESASATIDSDKITVLNFYAPWCPSCRSAHTNLVNEASQLPSNLQVLNVDYDSNTELRNKYGVTSQHTFVLIDRDGNKIKSIQWLNHISEILEFVWPELNAPQETTIDQEIPDPETAINTWVINSKNTIVEVEQSAGNVEPEVKQVTQPEIKSEPIAQSLWIYTNYESWKSYISDPNKRVVLFFHASRCPSCVKSDKDILANISSIPSDVVILKVNYDEASDLKQQHAVTYQHTFVQVNTQWQSIKKSWWLSTLSNIISFLE